MTWIRACVCFDICLDLRSTPETIGGMPRLLARRLASGTTACNFARALLHQPCAQFEHFHTFNHGRRRICEYQPFRALEALCFDCLSRGSLTDGTLSQNAEEAAGTSSLIHHAFKRLGLPSASDGGRRRAWNIMKMGADITLVDCRAQEEENVPQVLIPWYRP